MSTVVPEKNVRRNVVLSTELDRRFRAAIATKRGLDKGNISVAVAEAIELWLRKYG